EKLVWLNPDHYMAWNELKKIFIENPLDTMEEQMLLTQKAIMENPKSYFTWHHRYYIVNYIATSKPNLNSENIAEKHVDYLKQLTAHETKLCSLLLSVDSRNFHCWNYCIKNNILIPVDYSNYSSFRRTDLKVLELLFSDPDDEGSWRLYSRAEKAKRLGLFYARVYKNFIELIFKKPFAGELKIFEETVKIDKYVKYYRHEYTGTHKNIIISITKSAHCGNRTDDNNKSKKISNIEDIKVINGVSNSCSNSEFIIRLREKYLNNINNRNNNALEKHPQYFLKYKLSPLNDNNQKIIEDILKLQPNCVFAIKQKLKYT
ncbi:geranylgeranyl transferase type-2 subunit alpha, partial [Pancytospora epiphaga]